MSLCYRDTLVHCIQGWMLQRSGAHGVPLSLSLRQLSSNEGTVARNSAAQQKSTVRKRVNFEVMLVLQV